MDNENEFRDCLVNIYESRNKVVLPINKITCCDNRKPNVYIKHTGKSLAQAIKENLTQQHKTFRMIQYVIEKEVDGQHVDILKLSCKQI